METSNRHALKEWAVVCRALALGRQCILLRAGGIAEGARGFTVEHQEFWLFATRFHQAADELTEDAAPLLDSLGDWHPADGKVRLPLYAIVEQRVELDSEQQVARLCGRHVLAPQTVLNRFYYRRPGLTVLLVRAFLPPAPLDIPDAPHFGGCHSWVELPTSLSTDNLQPVLTDDEFAVRCEEVRAAAPAPST